MTANIEKFDLIGIGFGPANLSVAIALEEENQKGQNIKCCFIERKQQFEWHPGMLLDGTRMQISFLKDLVTLRNPASTYSFVNYLHENKRLNAFINMSTFQPSRVEFNDYLQWAAKRLPVNVHYGNEVISVEPAKTDEQNLQWVCVTSQDAHGNITKRLAKNIIVAVGGTPKLPKEFPEIEQLKNISSITHSSRYKNWRNQFSKSLNKPRIAIIGAGQSAAEIFVDLLDHHSDGEIEIINRERSIHPADDSPFVNEIFDPEFTNEVYRSDDNTRQNLLRRFQGTNYAVVDMPEISSIYETLYVQRITGNHAHKHRASHNIESAKLNDDQSWTLTMHNGLTGETIEQRYDAIILATGYQYQRHFELLENLKPWMNNQPVERKYRLPMQDNCKVNIYLQGCNEPSHGLSDTLLSVISVRADEITSDLINKQALKDASVSQKNQKTQPAEQVASL